MFPESSGPHSGGEKKHHEEPWLISYADMMTLLFGFFVLMYVFAKTGSGSDSVRENLAQYFGGDYVESESMKEIVDKFKSRMGDSEILKDIEVKLTPDGATFVFRSTVLFNSGSALLLPSANDALGVLALLIAEEDKNLGIVVEGHTDDRPISRDPFFSNWELSGARAGSVLRLFEKSGFERENLIGKSFADTQPAEKIEGLAEDALKEARAKNRRVVLHIFKPGSWSSKGI